MDKDYGDSKKAAWGYEPYDSSKHDRAGYGRGKKDREWWHAENLLGSDASAPSATGGGRSRGGGVGIGGLFARGLLLLLAGGVAMGVGWTMSALGSPDGGVVIFVGMMLAVAGAATYVGMTLAVAILVARFLIGVVVFGGLYCFFLPQAPGAAFAGWIAGGILGGAIHLAERLAALF